MNIAMSEETRIAQVIDRLRQSFPELPAATVLEVVKDMQVTFSGSRIREYVPLFIERRARTALTELAV